MNSSLFFIYPADTGRNTASLSDALPGITGKFFNSGIPVDWGKFVGTRRVHPGFSRRIPPDNRWQWTGTPCHRRKEIVQ
jgi:hypothetical protein